MVLIQYPDVHNGTLVLTLHSGYLAPYVTNFALVLFDTSIIGCKLFWFFSPCYWNLSNWPYFRVTKKSRSETKIKWEKYFHVAASYLHTVNPYPLTSHPSPQFHGLCHMRSHVPSNLDCFTTDDTVHNNVWYVRVHALPRIWRNVKRVSCTLGGSVEL